MPIIFTPNDANTRVAQNLDRRVVAVAVATKNAYDKINRLIYANAEFVGSGSSPDYDSGAVLTAFDTYSALGFTSTSPSTDLLNLQRILKALVNHLQAGTIVDDTVEATVTL